MRSHKLVFILGLAGLCALGLMLAGCSSDETPTGGRVGINEQYSAVVEQVNEVVDASLTVFGQGLQTVANAKTATEPGQWDDGAALSANFESDSVLSSDFWYVLYDADIQTSLSEIERDSILFTQTGAPVETARDADGMLIKHYWDVVYEQSDEPYTEYDLHGDFIFSGLNTSQAHVSGDLDVVVDETDPTASPEFNRQQTISATFTGFVIDENDGDWANGCPASGTVDATVQVQYQSGTAEPQVSNWTVQLTFINGTAQASVSDGDQDTTYVHTFRVPQ